MFLRFRVLSLKLAVFSARKQYLSVNGAVGRARIVRDFDLSIIHFLIDKLKGVKSAPPLTIYSLFLCSVSNLQTRSGKLKTKHREKFKKRKLPQIMNALVNFGAHHQEFHNSNSTQFVRNARKSLLAKLFELYLFCALLVFFLQNAPRAQGTRVTIVYIFIIYYILKVIS